MTAAHHLFTYAEYLARERETGLRHEYLDGQVFAMTGGTPEHARLIAAVTIALGTALDPKKCRVFSADLRIRIPATGLATYPDVAVVCGPVRADEQDPHAVTNPTALVEVLSPSTEAYDRGDKWDHYRRLESLRAYILVSPVSERLEAFVRTEHGFVHLVASGGDTLHLEPLGVHLDPAQLFAQAL